MELTKTPLEPKTQSGEDFIHIDDPRPPGDLSLSESIVNVDKEELITGDDPIIDSDDICGGTDDGERAVVTKKLELPEELSKSVMVLT